MNFRRTTGRAAIAALLAVAVSLYGDTSPDWRFFVEADGLSEPWTSFITVGPSGRVWVSHGGAVQLSSIGGTASGDGHYVSTLPSPGDDLKVVESASGRLWSLFSNGIQFFDGKQWQQQQIDGMVNSNPADRMVRELTPFAVGQPDCLFYLLSGNLMCFNYATREVRLVLLSQATRIGRFFDLTASPQGGIWVTGERGALRLEARPDNEAAVRWEYPLTMAGISELRFPIEDGDNNLIATACRSRRGGRELLALKDGAWRVLGGYSGQLVRGWPATGGDYWIWKSPNNLSRVHDGREIPEERNGILAAEFRDVAVEPEGVFWLTTSHGVARYTPPIWRTPLELAGIDSRVHAIFEDSAGGVWMAVGRQILGFNRGEWKLYDLPPGLGTQTFLTQSICGLPDGRIAVGTIPYNEFLLIFDPQKERFEQLRYLPESVSADVQKRYIGLIAPRRNGNILVQTFTVVDSSSFRIEEFDGKTFRTVLDRGNDWNFGNLRFLMDASDGALWIAGQIERGGGVYAGGEFHFLEGPPACMANGFFCLCEVSPGRIWVGGRHGIWQWDGREWSEVLTGLASVRQISRGADGTIWVASGTGVHRYVDGAWVTNTVEDGLPNTASFSILEDRRGNVWAGTIQGLSLYRPEADRDPPETYISERENPREVSPGGGVRLIFSGYDRWKQTLPERLLYSYRLDGAVWSPYLAGNTTAFSNLAPGVHRFEVRAMDVNLNYDRSPAALEFTVLLPWYRARGFQVVAGSGALLIIGLLGYALHRHLVLERLVVKRTNDLSDVNLRLEGKVADLKKIEETLKQEHSRLEATFESKSLLTEIASCLNSKATTGDEVIKVLDILVQRMHLDKVIIQNLDPENDEVNWPAVLLSTAEKAWIDSPQAVEIPPVSLVEAATRQWCVSVDGEHPGEPEWAEWFGGRGIGSACVFPVTTRGVPDGLIILGRSGGLSWKPEEVEILKTASDMIVNAWLRYSNSTAMVEVEKQRADAMQMAERASRLASIGVMAAGITHEINQPLNDIKVTADSVLLWDRKNRGILPGEFSDWLRSISGSVLRIDGIIRHMRSYWASPSRHEAEEISLNEAVHNALSLIGRQLANHGVQLVISEEKKNLILRGNRVHLEQIVLNLTVNAMHAVDVNGGPNKRIEVFLGRRDEAAVLEVRDNGVGIPEEALDKLFDPFFSTKKPGEGMGLGLAIVKRFVEGLAGRVKYWNNETGGATFRVEFPLSEASTKQVVLNEDIVRRR